MKGLEGSRLGRYELRLRVAQGGMSEVYLGYDRRVRRYVAVKVLYGRDEPFVRRFEREALSIGALAHEHILPLYDFGAQRPWYYLVMPFIEGGTLRDYLFKREHLSLEEAGSFLEQIASALQHAHDHGVIHRDVKPSNILLRPDGHAYLADFGLAKARLDATSLASSGTMIGTPEYMAPEQSNGYNDYRGDIYSLGIILYQMLTGRVPFTADSPVGVALKHIQSPPPSPLQFNSDIPTSIEEVMLKALQKSPEERYQEAQQFACAYQKALFQEKTRELEKDILLTIPDVPEKKEAVAGAPPTQTSLLDKIQAEFDSSLGKSQRYPLKDTTSAIVHVAQLYRQRRRIRPLYILLLVFLALLCLSLPFAFFWQSPALHIQTSSTKTNTDKQHIQTTQQAQATLAARAHIQATAGITSSIGAGKILYYDSMLQAGDGWLDDGSQCYFSPQGYHVYTGSPYSVAWCYNTQHLFANTVITAQAQLLYGDFYGLIFRLNPYDKAFYALEIDNKGDYRFQLAMGNNFNAWLTLIDWTHSTSLSKGYEASNALTIIAKDSTFRIYINKQLVVNTFTDTTYKTGFIGLLVGSDSANGTEAVFTHVTVFQK